MTTNKKVHNAGNNAGYLLNALLTGGAAKGEAHAGGIRNKHEENTDDRRPKDNGGVGGNPARVSSSQQ